MRPVNLIPPEDRRGEHAPLRTGALPYVLIGALVLLLVGVTALVLAGNQISEREGEVAKLEREDAQAAAKAQRLAAYTEFRAMSEQRVATVSELADSRFDWERVMRELALVLPSDVWLVGMTATAAPGVSVEGGASGDSGMRAAAPGPALELNGCADGQEAVAGFVTALEDIDGVTRVGVQSSELPEQSKEGGGEGGKDSGSGDECRTRDFIAKFEIVVAFDAAPVAESATEGEAPVATTAPVQSSGSESSEEEG
ncbi:MAG TPA: PilN domain-containing protein [Solirubrobacterales bacterium]